MQNIDHEYYKLHSNAQYDMIDKSLLVGQIYLEEHKYLKFMQKISH